MGEVGIPSHFPLKMPPLPMTVERGRGWHSLRRKFAIDHVREPLKLL
jgi:hypothetical protein